MGSIASSLSAEGGAGTGNRPCRLVAARARRARAGRWRCRHDAAPRESSRSRTGGGAAVRWCIVPRA